MIPIDRGEGGYPTHGRILPFRERSAKVYFSNRIHKLNRQLSLNGFGVF